MAINIKNTVSVKQITPMFETVESQLQYTAVNNLKSYEKLEKTPIEL